MFWKSYWKDKNQRQSIHQQSFPIRELYITFALNSWHLRVIAKKILRDFWEHHSDCEQQLKAWYKETGKATWNNWNDIRENYPSVSILNESRVCFNIKGNKYRLIVRVNFEYQMIWIRFIGTHAAYDKIDANKI